MQPPAPLLRTSSPGHDGSVRVSDLFEYGLLPATRFSWVDHATESSSCVLSGSRGIDRSARCEDLNEIAFAPIGSDSVLPPL